MFDPETFQVSDLKMIGTRKKLSNREGKAKPDCVFTSGIVKRDDGRYDLYSGVGDTAEESDNRESFPSKNKEVISFMREIECDVASCHKEVDVCVVGGGPAGIAAAVTAAAWEVKVFLAEKQQYFSGAATLSSVPAFMRFSDGEHFLAEASAKKYLMRSMDPNKMIRLSNIQFRPKS